jgi:hypothetical protein
MGGAHDHRWVAPRITGGWRPRSPTGAPTITGGWPRLDAVGGSLVLSGLSSSVARLIKLAGVSDVLYTTRVSDRGDYADPLELVDTP